jgi:iron(III) transport system ATP-binding protein
MTALDVVGLAMSFGTTEVLTDVSLSVPKHSITAVLGSSGSGKTTLLRIIAGFERPRAGVVKLAGEVIEGPDRHVAPERRRLGYVPQEGALFPHLSVAANVGFGLGRRGGRSKRVDELLELVGLPDLGLRYPHELSGGQQQRVALARALAIEPPVVLLDEPFSSLDAALRISVRADISRVLRESGTAVVLVTHDQQEALSMADQVAVLRDGRVAQVGRPREIYAKPVDAEMAAFLGEANLVDAVVSDSVAVTALGRLGTDTRIAASGTALIRPEQITISVGPDAAGLAGRADLSGSRVGGDRRPDGGVRGADDPGAGAWPDRLRDRRRGSADRGRRRPRLGCPSLTAAVSHRLNISDTRACRGITGRPSCLIWTTTRYPTKAGAAKIGGLGSCPTTDPGSRLFAAY